MAISLALGFGLGAMATVAFVFELYRKNMLCSQHGLNDLRYNLRSYIAEDALSSNSFNSEISSDIKMNMDCDEYKSYSKDLNIQNCLSKGASNAVPSNLVEKPSTAVIEKVLNTCVDLKENTPSLNGYVFLVNSSDSKAKGRKRKIDTTHSLDLIQPSTSHANESLDKYLDSTYCEIAKKDPKYQDALKSGLGKMANEISSLPSTSKEDNFCEEYLTCTDSENEDEPFKKEDKSIKFCRSCDIKEVNTIIRPCGHSYLCYDCAGKIFYLHPVCAFCSNKIIKCEKK